jgi:lysophospholipase L1-like esterase
MSRLGWLALLSLAVACSDGGDGNADGGSGGSAGSANGGTGLTGGAGTGGNTGGSAGASTGGATTGGTGGASGSGGTAGTAKIDLGSDGVLQIWTVGDSITEGVDNGYRNQLWSVLTGAGYQVDFVGSLVHAYPDTAICTDADHDGHSGYSIGGIEDEVDAWYAAIAAPDVVLVMAGTNDIAWWVAPGTTMPEVADDMLGLVDHLLGLNPNLEVIVGTIAPMSSEIVDDVQLDRAELTKEFNSALKQGVNAHAQSGTRLWIADVNAALGVDDLYDGIHPSREAHDKVGDAWLGVLQPLLVQAP